MRFSKSLLIVFFLLSGCTTIDTITTAFYVPDYKSIGTINVVPASAENNNSLEFSNYKSQFEKKLSLNGYQVVKQPSDAKFLAFVGYAISNGEASTGIVPVFGQTGGGTTYSSGTVYGAGGSASYSGSSYKAPTFGAIGAIPVSHTNYTRTLALEIVDANSIKNGQPSKVYESKVISTGTCSVFAGVFNELLESMFKDFPGENGGIRNLTLPFNGKC